MKVSVNPHVRAAFTKLAPEMKNWYSQNKDQIKDADLGLELERAFGERMLYEVCMPAGLQLGACLIAAIALIKEGDQNSDGTSQR